MALRHRLDDLRPRIQTGKAYRAFVPLLDMAERLLYSSGSTTSSAPHVRSTNNVLRRNWQIVLASVPATLIGVWNLGRRISVSTAPSDIETPGVAAAIIAGTLQFVPLLITVIITAVFWECLFATARRRQPGAGVFLTAWLFALIVPPTLPLYQAAVGMSFGFVFGRAVFGGAGRYVVNPSLLGLVFLIFAYPPSVSGNSGPEQYSLIELAASGADWWVLFLGGGPGPVGVASTAACLAGAAFLIATGAASWRIMTGAALGLSATLIVLGNLVEGTSATFAIPWHWHLVLGGFAFATVFLGTDPTTSPITNAGRWAHGAIIGVLTVLIRLGNPTQIEAVIFAILFASIVAPLFDFLAAELNVRRRRHRLREFHS